MNKYIKTDLEAEREILTRLKQIYNERLLNITNRIKEIDEVKSN